MFHVLQLGVWLALLLLCGRCWTAAVNAPEHVSGSGSETVGRKGQQHGLASRLSVHRNGFGYAQQPHPHSTAAASQTEKLPRAGAAGSFTDRSTSSKRRQLAQFGPVFDTMPDDFPALESILAAARDAFTFFEPHATAQEGSTHYVAPSSSMSRSLGHVRSSASRRARGAAGIMLQISFLPLQSDSNISLRLPAPPRTFNLTVESTDPHATHPACQVHSLTYEDQAVPCQGLVADGTTEWLATLVDADVDNLVLASFKFTLSSGASSQDIPVQLGLLSLEASFGQLAWAGMYYPRPRRSASTIIIHARILGAQVTMYTRQGDTELVWDVQWTGEDGSAPFFLVPGARNVFYANLTVDDTVLKSTPVMLEASGLSTDTDLPIAVAQQQQLEAAPQLLCTGEVEDVRGDAGTFPQSLGQFDAAKQAIFHPRGLVCNWELLPDQPDVLLSIDYRGLLPDEVLTLYLAPNNIIQLTRPENSPGAVFQTNVWVERSILVRFQTTRSSTTQVGAFSVSWTSVNSGNKGLLDGKTMVVVMACVSAAGAVLAACCFYFVCCSRRRRAGAVVDADAAGVQLLHVPSSVRTLLPSKPYEPPEGSNPLPGAATEPDCCSICLVELEPGEMVTVLPCMHFYHKDCIGSWLKRNCTCPLCKSNVLEAFKVQQHLARQSRRRRGSNAASGDSSTPRSRSSSSSRGGRPAAGPAAAAGGDSQHEVEMTAVQAVSPVGLSAAGQTEGSPSLWRPLGGATVPSPAAAVLLSPREGDSGYNTGLALVMLPSAALHTRPGRLPTLQLPAAAAGNSPSMPQQQPVSGSDISSMVLVAQATPSATGAAGLAVPPLMIPPSPSPSVISMVSLQSGTVQASPLDFAPAAAAAAAVLASVQRSPSASLNGSQLADAAYSAAQASVAALRTSSRSVGRMIQGLVSPRPVSQSGGSSSGRSRGNSRSSSPSELEAPADIQSATGSAAAPARVAVSIYAYAGHHPSAGEEEAEEHQQQQQQPVPAASAAGGAGDAVGLAGVPRAASFQAITVLNLPGSTEEVAAGADDNSLQQQQQQLHQHQRL